MIAAAGFKRLGIATASLVAVGIGALAAISFLIPAQSVRDAIKAELEAVTGLNTTIRGGTSVLLFPWGTVSFQDVVLGGGQASEPPLVAEQLTARLRLLPLLFGRIEAADLALRRPRIVVSFLPSGGSNWSSLTASLARTLQAQPGDGLISFSEIRIMDGSVSLRDAVHGIDETLSHVEMSLAWPAISKSFVATGRFGWRNEPIDASVGINDLRAAVEGERAGLKMRLSGAPFRLAFDGHISGRPTIKMEGTLAADTASLRRALAWAGQKPLPGGGFDRFALKAQTDLVGGSVALSNVNVELDGNTAEGVLTIAGDGRLAVQGTLAAEELDLTPYVSTVHLLRSSEREWSQVPIGLDGLTDFDLDLRLSAAKVDLASAKLGRTAMAVRLRDGQLLVTIGESQAFGGVLKGSFGLAKSASGAHIRSQLHFADVDLEACLGELFALRRVEGKGTLALAVEASGENVRALTETLAGSATLAAGQGALVGLNIEQLLRRLERRPLSGGAEFRSGRTPFDKLAVSVTLADGTARIDNVQLNGPGVRLELTGSLSIPTRDLDLKGTAGLVSARLSADGGFELPFVVQGPWEDPIMLPDAESLIRRSGAAAPLLDAVRDRKTRDAVRSAIERLSNGLPVPATKPPGPVPEQQ